MQWTRPAALEVHCYESSAFRFWKTSINGESEISTIPWAFLSARTVVIEAFLSLQLPLGGRPAPSSTLWTTKLLPKDQSSNQRWKIWRSVACCHQNYQNFQVWQIPTAVPLVKLDNLASLEGAQIEYRPRGCQLQSVQRAFFRFGSETRCESCQKRSREKKFCDCGTVLEPKWTKMFYTKYYENAIWRLWNMFKYVQINRIRCDGSSNNGIPEEHTSISNSWAHCHIKARQLLKWSPSPGQSLNDLLPSGEWQSHGHVLLWSQVSQCFTASRLHPLSAGCCESGCQNRTGNQSLGVEMVKMPDFARFNDFIVYFSENSDFHHKQPDETTINDVSSKLGHLLHGI